VRVDPMIHPEKSRVELVADFAKLPVHAVRVGDEHEIDLLPGRLPNPTSAAGVVEGRVVEVENAANSAGTFVRVRILDVDDEKDYVLGELVTAGAKPRRRRVSRREKPSAAEQARQLRELAEDAARQSASRPPIGISAITEEEEAQDKAIRAERKGEAQPDAIIIAEGAVQHAAAGNGDGRRKRRRRRRGGRGREEAEKTVFTPPPVPETVAAAPENGGHRRRRRRRGRRGRGGSGQAAGGTMPDRHIFEVASDGAAHPTGVTAAPEPSRAITRAPAPAPPAVEPPPPSLSVPPEEPKRTKPARRRKAAVSGGVAGELKGSASALALPATDGAPKRKRAAPKKDDSSKPKAEKPAAKRKRSTTGSRKKAAS
jgi:hypothetical protein